mmetsp:Transcript_6067/g.13352  ORF Transcript_6067/g.13352 Transcript_6067/m.13352 type:complete len:217 (-) Transcript_6067:63-713(-)
MNVLFLLTALLQSVPLVSSASRGLSKKGSKKASSPDLSWLVGTWYTCDTRAGSKINGVPFDTSGSLMCTEDISFEFTSLNEDKTVFSVEYFFADFCFRIGLSDAECPMPAEGLVELRKSFVATLSFVPAYQDSIVFTSNHDEYKDASGEWVPLTSDEFTDVETKTCYIGEDADEEMLMCDSIWHAVRFFDGVEYDEVHALSSTFTKDLSSCPVCEY